MEKMSVDQKVKKLEDDMTITSDSTSKVIIYGLVFLMSCILGKIWNNMNNESSFFLLKSYLKSQDHDQHQISVTSKKPIVSCRARSVSL